MPKLFLQVHAIEFQLQASFFFSTRPHMAGLKAVSKATMNFSSNLFNIKMDLKGNFLIVPGQREQNGPTDTGAGTDRRVSGASVGGSCTSSYGPSAEL